jgi:asparagine synthase (glutamine-hydrolysing)
VSVALSGDGADELFGGYNRYLIASKYWKLLSTIPRSLRVVFKKILSYLGPEQLKALALILRESNHKDLTLKLEKFLKIIDAKNIESYHLELCSQISAPERFLAKGSNNAADFFSLHDQLNFSNPIMRMMAVDTMHYLPTDILTKVDRAAMNYSLETRIPFLDLELFKFVSSLPMEYKVSKNTKYILRELAYTKIPKNILDRPKMGFGVPIKDWLRDELSDWANDLLSSSSLAKTGILKKNSIDNLWQEHVQLKSDNSHQLWNVLMLQSWLLEHANES